MILLASGIAGGALLCAGVYLLPQALKYPAIGHLKRQVAARRALVLTYDDGPGSDVDPPLLDLLRSHGAHATFFLLGAKAQQTPELADRIKADGHEIGCHGDLHVNALRALPGTVFRDIRGGLTKLQPWMPADGVYRPPGGKLALPVPIALRGRHPVGWWTLDSGDTHARTPAPESIVNRMCSAGGAVVLMHDHFKTQPRIEYVLKATELLIAGARREKMAILTMGELLRSPPSTQPIP